ncbi:hypothetical protein TYRP_021216 [Tyrophagus putrescentiae]|nr:hypothetical protein TYRP_021216 [Tyrophagus putrescentiae]
MLNLLSYYTSGRILYQHGQININPSTFIKATRRHLYHLFYLASALISLQQITYGAALITGAEWYCLTWDLYYRYTTPELSAFDGHFFLYICPLQLYGLYAHFSLLWPAFSGAASADDRLCAALWSAGSLAEHFRLLPHQLPLSRLPRGDHLLPLGARSAILAVIVPFFGAQVAPFFVCGIPLARVNRSIGSAGGLLYQVQSCCCLLSNGGSSRQRLKNAVYYEIVHSSKRGVLSIRVGTFGCISRAGFCEFLIFYSAYFMTCWLQFRGVE